MISNVFIYKLLRFTRIFTNTG